MESMTDLNEVTLFVCANCARPGKAFTSSGRSRPVVPDFKLAVPAQQVLIPCAGRLQPEHILRAFENGARIVMVVACREDNCHHAEGSRRCGLRIDFIRSILEEIGLGADRLLLSYLPGSASEDLALAAGKNALPHRLTDYETQVAAARDQVRDALRRLSPNPLKLLSQEPETRDSVFSDMVLNEVGSHE